MLQIFAPSYSKNISAEDTLVPPLWGKREQNGCFQDYLFRLLYAAESALSRWKLSTRWSKTAPATIRLRSRHRINPRPTRFVSGKGGERRWRPRRYQVDPWSRGREVARGVLRSSPKPEKRSIFLPSERDRVFLSSAFYTAAPKCVCIRRLAGARHVSPAVLWTLTRGSVGATNERPPFRFHDAVVGFVDPCLSRTRNLAASNKHLAEFCSGRSCCLAQHLPRNDFFSYFWKVWNCFCEGLCS